MAGDPFELKRPHAQLSWRGEDPHAQGADDVYFSAVDGLEESRTVFLAGAGFPERFSKPLTVVGELGFGTGLNVLALWDSFRKFAAPGARLHVVTVEGFPLTREDAARIDLVSTPFVRLRRLIEDTSFLDGDLDYHRVVVELQQALDANRVTLTCDDRTLRVGAIALPLPHREFALYAVLATAIKKGWAGAGPDGIGPDHKGWLTYDDLRRLDGEPLATFLDYYDRVYTVGVAKKERFDEFIGRLRHQQSSVLQTEFDDKFTQLLSKLRASLNRISNPYLRHRVGVMRIKSEGAAGRRTRFGLMLSPSEIELNG